jgi:formylglycine-generating enzyme required for sulfatase activity
VRYCRWLNEQSDDFDEQTTCYPPMDQIGPGMSLPGDFPLRTGYSLPTFDEWDHSARARSEATFCFGDDDQQLEAYAWCSCNSDDRTWPVGKLLPNAFGLFDVHGNVTEWCHAQEYQPTVGDQPIRGGSHRATPRFSWLTTAPPVHPQTAYSFYGFRIVKRMPATP